MTRSSVENPSSLTATVVADSGELAKIASEWQALAQSCTSATVFQTYEWNATWWNHFGRRLDRSLRLMLFREPACGRLVGLAPMMVGSLHGLPAKRLSFIGTGSSDYLDLVASPGSEEAVATAFYAELAKGGSWQIADLQQLRQGGLLRNHLPPNATLTYHDAPGEPCPYLPLPADWDTLTRQFGKKTRANVGYYSRGLHKVYEVSVGFVQDQLTLDGEMSRLFDLHQRRWNQRWLPGVFGSRSVQRFHREVAAQLLQQGCLRLFYLRLDGVTQACLYCFAFGDRLCYYQGGFEPTFAKLSLGTVLTAHAMQSAISEERGIFDFLRGDEPYKAKWTQQSAINTRRLITRGPAGRWSRLARRMCACEEAIERRAKSWARSRR